ncbi:GtrA family protein [Stenotrophomonas sp. NPDC047960]|uniref:GtrA family protein n=1 Tax=Stenotrophomonas sp. NPDC047960 TaxID=3364531 RepID=UPI0037214F11
MLTRQFTMFLLVGGFAAAVNFGSRIALGTVLNYVPSIVVAFCLGMVTAFVLNRALVFKSASNAIHHQAAWFVAINGLAMIQTVLVSLALARWVLPGLGVQQYAETIAHAVGVAVPVVTSYFGHKYLSFSTK